MMTAPVPRSGQGARDTPTGAAVPRPAGAELRAWAVVTDLLPRPLRRAAGAGDPGGPAPVLVAGAMGALWSVGLGLIGLSSVALLSWAVAGADQQPGPGAALRTAGLAWLAGHHAGVAVAGGQLGLAPLGLTAVLAALAYLAGGWTARTAAFDSLAGAGRATAAYAAPYTLLALLLGGLLAVLGGGQDARPVLAQCLVGPALLAAVAGGLGAVRASGALPEVSRRLPPPAGAVMAASAAAVSTLVGAGALLGAAGLAAHLPRALDLAAVVHAGPVGGFVLLLLGVAYLPNAAIWGATYAIGTGFAVGADTLVAPGGVRLGAVPAVPLLAALPASGPAPAASLLALVAPVAAGVLAGLVLHRRLPRATAATAASSSARSAPLRAAGWGLAVGATVGLVMGVLAALSGGPLAAGRLATVGPSAWRAGVAAAFEVGVLAALAVAAARRPRPDPAATDPAATDPGGPATDPAASPAVD